MNNLEDYTDFIPTSKILHIEEHLKTQIDDTVSQDRYIKSNQIYDLNEKAKPISYFQIKREMTQNQMKYIDIQKINGYLIYIITTIIFITITIFCIKRINEILIKRNVRKPQDIEESTQLQATAPTMEPSELLPSGEAIEENNAALYPKLRTAF